MLWMWWCFCHDINGHGSGRDVLEEHILLINMFMCIVKLDINVFGSGVKSGVLHQCNGTQVIAVNGGDLLFVTKKFE